MDFSIHSSFYCIRRRQDLSIFLVFCYQFVLIIVFTRVRAVAAIETKGENNFAAILCKSLTSTFR